MSSDTDKVQVPYASFRSFISFVDRLREDGIPDAIDRSVFGNISGGTAYGVLAALKALNLIDDEGASSPLFRNLVASQGDERKDVLRQVLEFGYPSLWNGDLNLASASSKQFDDHLRDVYQISGSTVDKAASFFLMAAEAADIPLSAHLKKRSPSSPSTSSRKSRKSRKPAAAQSAEVASAQLPLAGAVRKPLEYQLIDLMKEPDVGDEERSAIWCLVQFLSGRNQQDEQV
ncbi:MAG: DUF5343 domain-containing protein [Pseudomonadota bacterium]|nr:DUF5343 domain-containing protein [Pseudomonadota bacterium]